MKPGTFVILPLEALADPRLTLRQLKVLGALYSFQDTKSAHTVWPKRSTLAERCGLSVNRVTDATSQLAGLGWLRKQGDGGGSASARYDLLVPLERIEQARAEMPRRRTDSGSVPHPESGSVPHHESGCLPHPESGEGCHPESGCRPHPDSGEGCHPESGWGFTLDEETKEETKEETNRIKSARDTTTTAADFSALLAMTVFEMPIPDPVREVFDHWRITMGHPRSVLDPKRRKQIKARLAEGFSVEDLKHAVDGCKASPWHQGKNPTQAVYDDVGLIFRSAGKVESFMAQGAAARREAAELDAWLHEDSAIEGECRHV